MAGILRFVQGFNNSSNAMVDRDSNTSISSQEMQGFNETDVAEEAAEDRYGADEDGDDASENLIDVSFKESDVDRVDCVSDNHFQYEDAVESINDRRSTETQPHIQDDGLVSSGHGVVQSVDQIISDFEKAVSTGNLEKSTAILSLLVKHQAKLKVQLLSIGPPSNDPFTINVNVETYKVATGPKWKMQVTPSLTIFALKLKTSLLYGLPLSNQRWIMGKHIPGDTSTLRDYSIRDNAEVFLYLTDPQGGDSNDEIALVNGFHQKMMLQGIGNVELSFTRAEYNKYLKEAKFRQDSLLTNRTENGVHPNQRRNTQPPGPQAPLPWNTREDNHAQFLVESTKTREVYQFPADTNGPPRAFMGGDFGNNQKKVGGTSEIPKNTYRKEGSFPPPHLVQRGPPVFQKERYVSPENQPNANVFNIPPQRMKKKTARLEKRTKPKKALQRKPTSQLERCQSVGQLAGDSRQTGIDTALIRPRDFNYSKHGADRMDRVQSLNLGDDDFSSHRRDGNRGMDRVQSLNLGDAFSRGRHDGNRVYLRKPTPVKKIEHIDEPYNQIFPFQHANQVFQLNSFDGQQIHQPFARASRRHNDDDQYGPPRRHSLPSALDVGWECPFCTLVNPPQIPGCRGCFQDRPAEYEIPDYGSYIMDEGEARHVKELEKNEQKLVEMQVSEEHKQKTLAKQNRLQLYQAAEYNLTTNAERFECPICFSEIEPGEGVRLQECLHEICRECCANHINISNEAEVQCPYTDGENDCQQAITDREIRQLVGQAKYDEYKKRSLKSAEAKAANTFHCLTPNCEGFCFYDEEHNFFDCPICRRMSCLTCKVIHEGLNCREYQDDIRTKAANDETARQTQEQLQNLLRQGLAMNCPQCGVVIQKKGGCPNMTCSVCHRGFKWTGQPNL